MATANLIESSFLSAYLDQCKTLVKTMTIKSGTSADSINDDLLLKNVSSGVNLQDPTTWKYYMNISGQYHPTDTMMQVMSLDTQSTINFTKENLAVHVATKAAYSYGTRYYYSLLNQYPNQDQLIIGILYPVDINQAIAATEGTILGWPDGLVEPQEQTLMHELSEFVKNYLNRWNVPAFAVTDSLYNASYHAIMYLNILPKLINLRAKRCHTPEAHSFHIREYLASHKYLHLYLPYLTLKQAFYFYRNINYLMRNVGSVSTFNTLMQNILTDRRIPVAEYSIRQLSSFDDKYYPNISARRKPLNDQFNVGEISYVTVDYLYSKEYDLAYGNQRYYAGEDVNTTQQFKISSSSVIQTKDLESNMVDYNDAVPDPLPKVLMRQWAYMASHNLYNVAINFKDPQTGELKTLLAQDALIYYLYISMTSVGFQVDNIPQYMNWKARNNPKPTVDKLLSVVDRKFTDYPAIAKQIVDGQPDLGACFSTQMFFDLSYQIYQESQKHWFLTSNTGDLEKRGMLSGMILQLYHDEYIAFNVSSTNMTDWLSSVNMPVYAYTPEQATELMTNIFMASTGLEIDNTKLLKNIQSNLINMMMELSSYSVQTIVDINSSTIVPLNWPAARVGNLQTSTGTSEWLEHNSRINGVLGNQQNTISVESGKSRINSVVITESESNIYIETKTTVSMDHGHEIFIHVPVKAFYITATYDGYDPAVSNDAGYIGKENFLALSDAQKKQLASIPT